MRSTLRGFTLVELLVTIAIVAILTGIAAPSLMQTLQKQAVASAINTLASDLRLARSEAIKRGTEIELCGAVAAIKAGKASYACVAAAAKGDTTWADGWIIVDTNNSTVIKVQQLPIGIGAITASLASFTYLPSGTIQGIAGNVAIKPLSSQQTSLVQTACIHKTGRAYIITGATKCS